MPGWSWSAARRRDTDPVVTYARGSGGLPRAWVVRPPVCVRPPLRVGKPQPRDAKAPPVQLRTQLRVQLRALLVALAGAEPDRFGR